jgi:pimeloyl-ACP methyl ester carboxylesterase
MIRPLRDALSGDRSRSPSQRYGSYTNSSAFYQRPYVDASPPFIEDAIEASGRLTGVNRRDPPVPRMMKDGTRDLVSQRAATAMRDDLGMPGSTEVAGVMRKGRHRTVWTAAGLAASGLAWSVHAAYRRDIGAARARVATGSLVAETRCGSVEYASVGDGPPILLVHGAGGGFDQALDLGAPLAQMGFRVIAMSRFGYLRTPMPVDASAAAQADAHAALLDSLGIARASVVGASAGAPSSMQFALRYPERCSALVLVVPAAYVPRPDGAPSLRTPPRTLLLFDTVLRTDFLFWAAARLSRDILIRSILGTPPAVVQRAEAAEQARVATVLEHVLPVSARRLGLLNDGVIVTTLGRYDLERIAAPTLAIGAADCLYGTFDVARYSAEHIRGARFIGYPTGGHLWVGHHDELLSEVADFLKHPSVTEQAPP